MSADPRAVLLRDIRDDPDDDVPRLILGDLLADQGDPRGELIQIEVKLHLREKDRAERQRLNDRRRQLLAANAFRWLGPLADVASHWEFHRGFIQIVARASKLLQGEGLNTIRCPEFDWVDSVHLTDFGVRWMTELAESGLLARITHLNLTLSTLGNEGARHLLLVPGVCDLRGLELASTRVGEQGAIRLAASENVANLRYLGLSNNGIGDVGARALIESPHLANLRRLDLRGCALHEDTVAELKFAFGDRLRIGRR